MQPKQHNDHIEHILEGCFIQPNDNSHHLSQSTGPTNQIIFDESFHPHRLSSASECSEKSPCFCLTNHYFKKTQHSNDQGRNTKANGQFIVTWDLNLGGQESLLDSVFLRAGFEQSVKDYINNDILCSDDLSVKGAEFFGVELPIPDSNEEGGKRKKRAISGNGMCKGDIRRCEKPVQLKKKIKNAEANVLKNQISSNAPKLTQPKKDDCAVFLSSTIFDAFKEMLLMASAFNYDVDVDTINDLEGNLDLSYEVDFQPTDGDGLDKIDDVGMEPEEPVAIDPACTESQCFSQREVMKNIFSYFGIPFDENKHECMHQGINCNSEDLVTYIWIGKNFNINWYLFHFSYADVLYFFMIAT